jgi:hypothetical protein
MMITQLSYSVLKNQLSLLSQAGVALCVCLFLYHSFDARAEGDGRIVKWKDDKGVTHYGDRIPAQYSNRESSVINRQGVTVKHNRPINTQEQVEDNAKLEQGKKDKALLAAFTNAHEIDLARDRNIQLDLIAVENLQQERNNNQKLLSENKKLAASFTKSNKAIPEDLNADITRNIADIKKINQRIDERKQAIENTRRRFDDDKKRYLSLKHLSLDETEKTQTAPTASDKSVGSSN